MAMPAGFQYTALISSAIPTKVPPIAICRAPTQAHARSEAQATIIIARIAIIKHSPHLPGLAIEDSPLPRIVFSLCPRKSLLRRQWEKVSRKRNTPLVRRPKALSMSSLVFARFPRSWVAPHGTYVFCCRCCNEAGFCQGNPQRYVHFPEPAITYGGDR
jgi:hypothetical protein